MEVTGAVERVVARRDALGAVVRERLIPVADPPRLLRRIRSRHAHPRSGEGGGGTLAVQASADSLSSAKPSSHALAAFSRKSCIFVNWDSIF